MLASTVVAYLEDLAGAPDLATLRKRALRAGELLSGSATNFNEMAGDGRTVTTVAREDRLVEPDAVEAYLQLRGYHPVVRRLRPEQGIPGPVAISQVTDEASFRANPLFRDLYRQLGMVDQLLIAFPRDGGGTVSLAIGRRGWGFSERELQLAALLHRVLRTVHGWQTERERLVAGPPDALGRRLEGLTPRQAEVMERVLAGRTSQGIAADLGISTRTVEKHLEGAYRRLGVRNRVEAVALLLGSGGARAAIPI